MASKQTYVQNFRSATAAMIDAINKEVELVGFFHTMGWTKEDFDPLFANDSELSSQEFYDAVTTAGELATMFAEQATKLGKMKA